MPACWPWWERWMERMRRRLFAVHLPGFGSLSDRHSLKASGEVTLHRWSRRPARGHTMPNAARANRTAEAIAFSLFQVMDACVCFGW